jgi:hypothetical protein
VLIAGGEWGNPCRYRIYILFQWHCDHVTTGPAGVSETKPQAPKSSRRIRQTKGDSARPNSGDVAQVWIDVLNVTEHWAYLF